MAAGTKGMVFREKINEFFIQCNQTFAKGDSGGAGNKAFWYRPHIETRFCIEALKTGKQMLGIADLGKVYDQIVLFTVLNKKI